MAKYETHVNRLLPFPIGHGYALDAVSTHPAAPMATGLKALDRGREMGRLWAVIVRRRPNAVSETYFRSR
ncbi:hypothetical protein, partial [Citreimonas sp.]|uniref:hypothetical protein n=1 Tax=Citreimonas sp. TaxID=3036715 RepID=UPI0035C86A26